MWHAANSKPWKETLDLRYSVMIRNSKSQSGNIKDRQEKLSVKLCKNPLTVTMLWWCRTFKVFRIDMKDDSRKMKEGWHKWLDPKHEMLFVVKEATCCMNIKFFFKQEKEKKSSWKARCSRKYSHAQCKLSKNLTWQRSSTRANYTTLGIAGGTIEKTVANWGSHDGVSRRKLPRKLRKWEASCYQRTTGSEFSSKRHVAGIVRL